MSLTEEEEQRSRSEFSDVKHLYEAAAKPAQRTMSQSLLGHFEANQYCRKELQNPLHDTSKISQTLSEESRESLNPIVFRKSKQSIEDDHKRRCAGAEVATA